jgi:hypothetical protein
MLAMVRGRVPLRISATSRRDRRSTGQPGTRPRSWCDPERHDSWSGRQDHRVLSAPVGRTSPWTTRCRRCAPDNDKGMPSWRRATVIEHDPNVRSEAARISPTTIRPRPRAR